VLVSLVLVFVLLAFAVDKAYAGGGYGHGRGHGGGHGYGRSHSRSYARHRGYRGHRGGYYGRGYGGYGYNGWDSFGYGLAGGIGYGVGAGLVDLITRPRPVIVYDNIQPVIVRERVIIQKPIRYTPPPIDYRYHKIIKPEPIWEH